MVTRRKATRADCAHEAGHAFARWYLGFRVDLAQVYGTIGPAPVFPEPQRAAGRVCGEEIVFRLTPERAGIASPRLREWYRRKGVVRAEAALVVLAAGPVAEARARRSSEVAVWVFGGGTNDYRQAREIAGHWLYGDSEDMLEIACVRARTLLRSPRAIKATTALSDALRDRGRLGGDEVAVLCAGAFAGRQPAREAWFEAWPPTLGQLREAHVPVHVRLSGHARDGRKRHSTRWLPEDLSIGVRRDGTNPWPRRDESLPETPPIR